MCYLQRVDSLACLLNVLANGLRDELGHQVLQVTAAGLTAHDLNHLLADGADLGVEVMAGDNTDTKV